ncbi:MAG TPA: 16S rRNA (guanine(527)-N(7))-methyltransferase RsmG [Bacteroidia bacterium]|nr:16S rRNA (guanine(527)-N(7))-methyltransferase RsmG [Bacteroidia bacterium]
MRDSSIILKYFPDLDEKQKNQFAALFDLYEEWNNKINLISRKDFEFFYERHVLHSLAIARIIQFNKDAEIMDVGTGGGFPGIPLAILFPAAKFTLVDSIEKKIKAVNGIIAASGLTNVNAVCTRAEKISHQYDFIISRATATIDELVKWTKGKYKKTNQHTLPNGLICLKGGDLTDEVKEYKNRVEIFEIKDFFKEEFFETKKVVFVNA